MADKPKDKGGKKPSAPEPANTTEILITMLAALLGVALLLGFLQNKFGDGGQFKLDAWARGALYSFSSKVNEYTPEGSVVRTTEQLDVWASSLRDRIVGIQQKGARGKMLSQAVVYGKDVFFNVDFDSDPDGWVDAGGLTRELSGWVGNVRSVFLWLSWTVTLAGVLLALYSWKQWRALVKKHKLQMRQLDRKLVGEDISAKNERWDHVEKLAASENPGDWRVAIIEADVLLDELVTGMGYDGATLGDKLKAIEKSDFVTLEDAWEAHKIRNRIAHQGSDFVLTHRETKRVIDLFGNVFREFDYI